ncbi:MAG TPA: hypothetical protein PLD37_00135 [Usitatibacteraceae bacterium]|jgi:hypothetical protein|nr:hypothetical protein [Usitatibacteraceae bacterium]
MSKLGYLDTLHNVAVAVVVAGLLAGWANTTSKSVEALPNGDVSLTQDGRMKVSVTAPRPAADVRLAEDGTMRVTVTAQREAAETDHTAAASLPTATVGVTPAL